jgi:hypothetical protein
MTEAIEFLVFVAIVIAIIVRSVKKTEKNNAILSIRELFLKTSLCRTIHHKFHVMENKIENKIHKLFAKVSGY